MYDCYEIITLKYIGKKRGSGIVS